MVERHDGQAIESLLLLFLIVDERLDKQAIESMLQSIIIVDERRDRQLMFLEL